MPLAACHNLYQFLDLIALPQDTHDRLSQDTHDMQVEACSHDSTDSLIKAQHTALLEYGGAMSSSNSMTCPTLSQLPDSPRNLSSLAKGKSKSPLQLETRSWSASRMRSMNSDRRAEQIASPNFLKKVAVIFKTMLSKPTQDEEAAS